MENNKNKNLKGTDIMKFNEIEIGGFFSMVGGDAIFTKISDGMAFCIFETRSAVGYCVGDTIPVIADEPVIEKIVERMDDED